MVAQWLEHLPVTQKVAGSSPVHPASNTDDPKGRFCVAGLEDGKRLEGRRRDGAEARPEAKSADFD